MRETKPVEELYDIQADPGELVNVVDSLAHQEVLKRMRAAHTLRQLLQEDDEGND